MSPRLRRERPGPSASAGRPCRVGSQGAALVVAAPVVWISYDGDILVWAELPTDNVPTIYAVDLALVAAYQ